jgi:C-terminal processing protease CtpA/Prc
MLLIGLAILQVPGPLHAQTAEERARQEEIRQRIERIEAAHQERRAQLEHLHQERLVRLEEALARARERMAEAEFHQQEMSQEQLEEMERVMAEAKARYEHEFAAQSEARARHLEEARARYAEAAELQREHALEARELAREAREKAQQEIRKAQQVVVRVRARVRLGVELNGNQAEAIDDQGALIQGVMEDTPAEEAGLREGDIVTHLNGHSLLAPIPGEADEDFDEDESLPVQRLMALAQDLDAGDEVVLRYLRDGSPSTVTFEAAEIEEPSIAVFRGDRGELGEARVLRIHPEGRGVITMTLPDEEIFELNLKELEGLEKLKDLQIELEEMEALKDLKVDLEKLHLDAPNVRIRGLPGSNLRAFSVRGGESPLIYSVMGRAGRYGLELAEMNPGLSEYFSADGGLLVLNVDEDSALGILPGDVIQAVDGRDVEDQADLFRILGSYEEDESVTFTVVRKGQQMRVEGRVG